MGLFSGIGKAEIFKRGNFFPAGFEGDLKVVKTSAIDARKSGPCLIVEFDVINVKSPGKEDDKYYPVKEGEKRTWLQKLLPKEVAHSAIKAWAAATWGYELADKKGIKENISPILEKVMEKAADSPYKNDFTGERVHLKTVRIKTREDTDFTRHDWSPSDDDAEE